MCLTVLLICGWCYIFIIPARIQWLCATLRSHCQCNYKCFQITGFKSIVYSGNGPFLLLAPNTERTKASLLIHYFPAVRTVILLTTQPKNVEYIDHWTLCSVKQRSSTVKLRRDSARLVKARISWSVGTWDVRADEGAGQTKALKHCCITLFR